LAPGFENNQRAIRVYEKCGFIQEGRMRQARYLKGQYIDVIIFLGLCSLSINADITVSIIDISDVNPANIIARKKSTPISAAR